MYVLIQDYSFGCTLAFLVLSDERPNLRLGNILRSRLLAKFSFETFTCLTTKKDLIWMSHSFLLCDRFQGMIDQAINLKCIFSFVHFLEGVGLPGSRSGAFLGYFSNCHFLQACSVSTYLVHVYICM